MWARSTMAKVIIWGEVVAHFQCRMSVHTAGDATTQVNPHTCTNRTHDTTHTRMRASCCTCMTTGETGKNKAADQGNDVKNMQHTVQADGCKWPV